MTPRFPEPLICCCRILYALATSLSPDASFGQLASVTEVSIPETGAAGAATTIQGELFG
ncbi:MAG TPA: hypothetical protein VHZ03_08730 [Trebonia sp.]|jgi:hypothetical protein|nr:hypothetical protein [Trebonia sp.]